jgi:hypothetical protein
MATWTVYAKYKKSTVEREFFTKDGKSLYIETGWRSGSFLVETETDEPPAYDVENSDDLEVYGDYPEGVESVDLNETWDGCWTEYGWPDDMPEEERERLEARFEEDTYFEVLEDEGWEQDNCEMWLVGPLVIEDEDGNVVADGDSEDN